MFTNALIRAKNHKLNEMESILRVDVLSFHMTLDALDTKNDQSCVNWGKFVNLMKSAVAAARKLLDNKYHLDTWTNHMKDFALRRALEKVMSHHRHPCELVGFARSQRLHRSFSLQPIIDTVPDSFDSVPRYTLLGTQAAWLALLQDMSADAPEVTGKPAFLDNVSATLHGKVSGVDQNPTVRSECALVAYYERHRVHGGPPPFSYIGVSKFCCMPCHLWLQAVGTHRAELPHAGFPRKVGSRMARAESGLPGRRRVGYRKHAGAPQNDGRCAGGAVEDNACDQERLG